MYCRKCGAEIKDSASFCDHCGAEVVKVKQRSYSEKYNDQKKQTNKKDSEAKRREKHKDEKNPYVSAAMFATIVSLVLAMFPWNLVGKNIGTSLPMRISVVVFALLGDYHATKAKQVNNMLYSRYGFRIQENIVKVVYILAVFATVLGLFALFMYEA